MNFFLSAADLVSQPKRPPKRDMLNDADIDAASRQLEQLKLSGEEYHKTQTEVWEKYASLMENYRRLKSDYEEERDAREKYKQLARGQEKNPFVLVLIDGDGFIFDDDLVRAGAEGGSRAAQVLNDAIGTKLRAQGLDHCRVMVRIYANLVGLSKVLSRSKLCGAEKRSLGPFVANFNRSNDLFDFVDSGELKENADFKIRAMFRQFADNPQCKHIFFAATHDVGYVSELLPYVSNRDRFTLVRSHSTHAEFKKLGFRMEELRGVFRNSPLPTESQPPYKSSAVPPSPSGHTSKASADQNPTKICYFYQKGLCKYGTACTNSHGASNGNVDGSSRPSDSSDWRTESASATARPPVPIFQKHSFMGAAGSHHSDEDFASMLPKQEDVPPNKIPVNKSQHRLDTYAPPPRTAVLARFNSRIAQQKLCNNFHLKGFCTNDQCEYDHESVSPEMRDCLAQVARGLPCARRGACRSINCISGHICQRPDCKHRGGKNYCKLGSQAHGQDLQVAGFVPALVPTKHVGDDEDGSVNDKASYNDSPPSPGLYSDAGSEQGNNQNIASLASADKEQWD
ncbi:C-x8-C-x5-C-x3-H type zinc finger protein [Zymoseptoria brevis]|uniref:C-x8-C-x5-C-x3-H type zinc finger protein n=1 Tax=Zymoseptoria brevis TaxID=1047168 RepID=A0A0F4GIM4_9PEZI|nr:C-x8-C-x5-C-x3-H type zinc finger protein [Zymoseptoria brevis]